MAEVKKEEKKGPLGKLKEVAEDKEEPVSYTHLTLPTRS